MPSIFETYFSRFEAFEKRINEPVSEQLGIIVTIPCYFETDILHTINSICACEKPHCDVEILVVVNHGEHASTEVKTQNQKTLDALNTFCLKCSSKSLKIIPIKTFDIPQKQAGVGYARKVAMDEATHRFAQINNPDGIIVSCDADTLVAPNYLVAIEEFYQKNANIDAATIAFAHQSTENEAILQYELYMRYYVEQLKRIGFPYAFHTVGSCFSVRAKAYCRQGGMNKRQAGEDFYFLQKVFQTETVGEINTTLVMPSPRASDRVPFGTGTAVATLQQNGQNLLTYPMESFDVLQDFFSKIPLFQNCGEQELREAYNSLNTCFQKFLLLDDFKQKIIEIQHNTASEEQFRKRFFQWFNGFLVFKFLNFSCQNGFQKRSVVEVAKQLIHSEKSSTFDVLRDYRRLQHVVV
ncbi:MAG: glycosyltransferase family 2 protein [Bacteroidales bacterium]|nr:glycosyltransferase family 2 protein [Bacteroidales bacterium]